MIETVNLSVAPADAHNSNFIRATIISKLSFAKNTQFTYHLVKRSIDARSKNVRINLLIEVYIGETPSNTPSPIEYKNVKKSKEVIVVGAGPAGLFAALQLIENGLKPVVVEQGKNVKERRRDLAAINRNHIVNPHSNYCFGEGGAGTYSDGKLYTRSTKRGDVRKVLQTFIDHGADPEILVDAHPHIGTNKLPGIIESIRETIKVHGGEVLFNTQLKDIIISNNQVKGIIAHNLETDKSQELLADNLILATGHSARNIFELLHSKSIMMEAKTFAMGVRVEHPQTLIDAIQYHCNVKEVEKIRKHLPAASYSLVHQALGRGVYSFCNCPGGIIAPCATQQEEVVTNGWSPSKRNNPYSNSGIVVTIEDEDLQAYKAHGVLSGLKYQQALEKAAWESAGKTQAAPAQKLIDFVSSKSSSHIPSNSYQPGTKAVDLHKLLPKEISERLQIGFKAFGIKMNGYLSEDAVILGVESRTSSPIRIPRNKETLQHLQIKGLYPCGEGAGYAGGIASAAIDGQKCANAITPS